MTHEWHELIRTFFLTWVLPPNTTTRYEMFTSQFNTCLKIMPNITINYHTLLSDMVYHCMHPVMKMTYFIFLKTIDAGNPTVFVYGILIWVAFTWIKDGNPLHFNCNFISPWKLIPLSTLLATFLIYCLYKVKINTLLLFLYFCLMLMCAIQNYTFHGVLSLNGFPLWFSIPCFFTSDW